MSTPPMPSPGYWPPAPPPRRPRWSAVSVLLVASAWSFVGLSVLAGLFLFVFLDDCPPETCDADQALGSLAAGLGVGVVGAVVGTVVTGLRGRRDRAQWPWALLAVVIAVAACMSGFFGFYAAV